MKKALLAIIFLALVGCAGTKNMAIDRAILPTLNGKSVILIKHQSPDFLAMTSGKGMFALVGVGAAVSAGNQLVEDNQIEDPAAVIGEQLARELSSRYGLSSRGLYNKIPEKGDFAKIVELASGNDYALDVATNGWSFVYDGFHFSDYLVGYSVKFRLIDVANAKTISEGLCAYDTKSAGKPLVGYETLVENNAAYIKQSLEEASSFCVDKIRNELF